MTTTSPDAGPVAFTAGHHFTVAGDADPCALADAAIVPLSVIAQVTKRCDFGCVFCSETLMMGDPTLAQLSVIQANLAGVRRVFLSGGEPLLRRDLPEIVDMFSGFVLGLPTNATRGVAIAPLLTGKVAFVNVGFDGPRATFSKVRGDYDKAMAGLRAFADAGLPVSLSAVVLRSTLHALAYLYQIADVLDCGKLKRCARGTPSAWPSGNSSLSGDTQAWPVYDQPDLFLKLGNLLREPVTRIWDRYPYKQNHFAKYLGASICTAARGGT